MDADGVIHIQDDDDYEDRYGPEESDRAAILEFDVDDPM
jgi:hypothetical protein